MTQYTEFGGSKAHEWTAHMAYGGITRQRPGESDRFNHTPLPQAPPAEPRDNPARPHPTVIHQRIRPHIPGVTHLYTGSWPPSRGRPATTSGQAPQGHGVSPQARSHSWSSKHTACNTALGGEVGRDRPEQPLYTECLPCNLPVPGVDQHINPPTTHTYQYGAVAWLSAAKGPT